MKAHALLILSILSGSAAHAADSVSIADAARLTQFVQSVNGRLQCTSTPPPPSFVEENLLRRIQLQDNEICAEHRSLLEQKIGTAQTLNAGLDRIRDAKVILLGEEHAPDGQAPYPLLLRALKEKAPDLNCLFMEEAPSGSMDILAMQNGGESMAWWLTQYRGLVREAKALGIAVITADTAASPPDDRPYPWRNPPAGLTPAAMKKRNEGMAGRIQSKLRNGSCKRAVMVVGLAHLSGVQPTIPALLNKDKVSFKTAAILRPQTLTWQACQEAGFQVEKPLSFSSKDLGGLPVQPAYDTLYSDFDQTFVVP